MSGQIRSVKPTVITILIVKKGYKFGARSGRDKVPRFNLGSLAK